MPNTSHLTSDEMRALKFTVDYLCALAYTLTTAEHAQALVNEISQYETTLPIFNPTRYLQVRDTIPGHLKLTQAFSKFRKEIETIFQEDKARDDRATQQD